MPSPTTLLEIAGRVALMYIALLAMLRVTGRRELAELSPMELLTVKDVAYAPIEADGEITIIKKQPEEQ